MSSRLEPLYSLHEKNVELEDELDRFVVGLGEAVDQLQDAESASDLDQLDDLATALAARASRLGYPELEQVAQRVCGACQADDKPAVQRTLVELTELSRRIRLGHRGAA